MQDKDINPIKMPSTWSELKTRCSYESYISKSDCLVVTATNDSCVDGVIGMIKSFQLNADLDVEFLVLAKDVSKNNAGRLESLYKTRVNHLLKHNANDHWCTWILEIFFLKKLADYEYVFYVDADIMVLKPLREFLRIFDIKPEDRVCVVDHKRVWHKEWFYRDDHNFNAGFIVYKGTFFNHSDHQSLRKDILRAKPLNIEKYLRWFFNKKRLLYAPTKFNGRIIWLNERAVHEDDVYVVHFVGQEHKPWKKNCQAKHMWLKKWRAIYNS